MGGRDMSSLISRMDHACDRFEEAWRADRRPRLEDYLAEAPEPERPWLLRHLLRVELELRHDRGEAPTPDDYARRLPEYGAVIEAAFAPPPSDVTPTRPAAPVADDSAGATAVIEA